MEWGLQEISLLIGLISTFTTTGWLVGVHFTTIKHNTRRVDKLESKVDRLEARLDKL